MTSVQAEQRSDGGVTFVACRESDLRFKSHFIANKAAVAAGKIRPVKDLQAAKDMLAGCTFTFGSKSSTNLGVASNELLLDDRWVILKVPEIDQGGMDLNGDGDALDEVVHVAEFSP